MITAVPEDLSSILREIDQVLKESGIKPHQRGLHAILEFGRRFNISLPIVPLSPNSDGPKDLVQNNRYTQKILNYFDELYGTGQLVDPSEKARVVVFADGDLWQLPIPLIWGTVHVAFSQEFLPSQPVVSRDPVIINPCQELLHITPKRLQNFSVDDLNEVAQMFKYGKGAKDAFDRFRDADFGFVEAENDWFASVAHLTTREPANGQSRWSSLQMVEKFMKSLLRCIGDVTEKEVRKCSHDLEELHTLLERSMPRLDLKAQITIVTCSDKVRYGEVKVPREDAYAAHKASIAIVSQLGTIRNSNQ